MGIILFFKMGKPGIITGLLLYAILSWGLVAMFYLPTPAQADYQIFDTETGNYHVTVWGRPNPLSVGKVHMLIRLGRKANISQEYPVRGAKVTVLFKQLSGPGTEPNSKIENYHKTLSADETDPGNYEMEDSLLSEGRYQTFINLDSDVGTVQTSFEFSALPEPDDRLFSIMLLALFPIGLFSLIYLYLRRPPDKGNKPEIPDLKESTDHQTVLISQNVEPGNNTR